MQLSCCRLADGDFQNEKNTKRACTLRGTRQPAGGDSSVLCGLIICVIVHLSDYGIILLQSAQMCNLYAKFCSLKVVILTKPPIPVIGYYDKVVI